MGADTPVLAPKVLIIPTNTGIVENPQTGTMVISGANLLVFNGTDWKQCNNA
jgi:hypothetical protein